MLHKKNEEEDEEEKRIVSRKKKTEKEQDIVAIQEPCLTVCTECECECDFIGCNKFNAGKCICGNKCKIADLHIGCEVECAARKSSFYPVSIVQTCSNTFHASCLEFLNEASLMEMDNNTRRTCSHDINPDKRDNIGFACPFCVPHSFSKILTEAENGSKSMQQRITNVPCFCGSIYPCARNADTNSKFTFVFCTTPTCDNIFHKECGDSSLKCPVCSKGKIGSKRR